MELVGIAAPNKFLFHFMKYYKIEKMSKVMKCVDNRAVISFVNKTQGTTFSLEVVQRLY